MFRRRCPYPEPRRKARGDPGYGRPDVFRTMPSRLARTSGRTNLLATCARPDTRRPIVQRGGVPEWSNGAVSKTVVRASAPWVRIPPPPPEAYGILWHIWAHGPSGGSCGIQSGQCHSASVTHLKIWCKKSFVIGAAQSGVEPDTRRTGTGCLDARGGGSLPDPAPGKRAFRVDPRNATPIAWREDPRYKSAPILYDGGSA